jgi:hypothetical protein
MNYLRDFLENKISMQDAMKIALMLDVEMDEAYDIAIQALIKAAFDKADDLTVEEIETAHEMCKKVDITWRDEIEV